jgi:O-acetylserine/cysteine efflux transporter
MERRQLNALLALAAAGALWGLTVPLSKLSLAWLSPGWLAVARFLIAVPPLAVVGRKGLRTALEPRVIGAGALGFGAVIVLQNLGIAHTSVSHAALIVGAVPVLVAVLAAALRDTVSRPAAWGGHLLALIGIGFVAGGGGGGATMTGDLLMLASAALSALFIVVQPRLLAGRDPAAVTAVQFGAGALFGVPLALLTEGLPHLPSHPGTVGAFAALIVVGTICPFWLFAFGQSRVSATLAGTFVNLEPLVGAAVGWFAFGNRLAVGQLLGAVALLAGIGLATAASQPARGPVPVGGTGPAPARDIGPAPPGDIGPEPARDAGRRAGPQAARLRLARCWPTLRLTRWSALSTVLQSQPIRRATSS